MKVRVDEAAGRLVEKDGRWQLRFTRRLARPPDEVWRALTEPEDLAAWFPTTIEGERRTGAALRFRSREGDPTIEGQMIRYDPPSVLELRWGDDETLHFELQPDGDGTLLTFIDTFDQLGKAARDGAGWHVCLDALAYHLAGQVPPWTQQQHWRDVHAAYLERLGPEASTIGPPEGWGTQS